MRFIAIAVICSFFVLMDGYLLAGWWPAIRPMYCKLLRWHSYSYEPIGFDGASVHARCKWCGYEGMVDSQGNLF